MATKFVIVELQTWDTGAITSNVFAFDTEASAWAKYYTLCASAVASSLPVVSVTFMNNKGFRVEYKCFEHEATPETPAEESAGE